MAVFISDIFSPAKTFTSFGQLVHLLLLNAMTFAGIIAMFLLIFGGITIILGAGGGDPKKLDQGKQTITAAILGLILIVFAVWIIQILEKFLGVSLLNPVIP